MSARRRSLAPPRRRFPWRLVLTTAGIAFAFIAGIGLGEALHDNPRGGPAQTIVRTLRPLPLVPVARNTVTVTTTITTSSP